MIIFEEPGLLAEHQGKARPCAPHPVWPQDAQTGSSHSERLAFVCFSNLFKRGYAQVAAVFKLYRPNEKMLATQVPRGAVGPMRAMAQATYSGLRARALRKAASPYKDEAMVPKEPRGITLVSD